MRLTTVAGHGVVTASTLWLVSVAVTTSCSDGGGMSSAAAANTATGAPALLCPDAGGPVVGDLPCDVGHVLTDKCQPCHQIPQRNHAHFPLLTFEDTQQPFGIAPGERRWQRMAQVIEPGTLPHMPYGTAPQLTPTELDTLRSWFRACAPPVPDGQGCDVGEPSRDH